MLGVRMLLAIGMAPFRDAPPQRARALEATGVAVHVCSRVQTRAGQGRSPHKLYAARARALCQASSAELAITADAKHRIRLIPSALGSEILDFRSDRHINAGTVEAMFNSYRDALAQLNRRSVFNLKRPPARSFELVIKGLTELKVFFQRKYDRRHRRPRDRFRWSSSYLIDHS